MLSDGTILERSTDAGATWTAFTCVQSITGPDASVTDVKRKCLSQSTVRRIAGVLDNGTLSVELEYLEAEYALLHGWLALGTIIKWRITPGGVDNPITFDGFVKSIGQNYPYDDIIVTPFTVSIDGAITIA